jgi:hypothetical protein
MSDPVSWLLIEPGWSVVDEGGGDAGRVEAVTGDSNADIFDGLAIASGMFARPRYVEAAQVAEITQGRVRLSLDRDAIAALPEYEDPAASIAVEPDAPSRVERAEARLEHRDERERETTLVRRVLTWFGLSGRR